MSTYLVRSKKYPAYWRLPPEGTGYFLPRAKAGFVWGHLNLVLFLLELARRWNGRMPGRKMDIGDLSLEGGMQNQGNHAGHKYGVEVDIYVCRKDNLPLEWPANISCCGCEGKRSESYDPDATEKLAETILGSIFPMQQVAFTCKELRAKFPAIQNRPNHTDHFHVTLYPLTYSKADQEAMDVFEEIVDLNTLDWFKNLKTTL